MALGLAAATVGWLPATCATYDAIWAALVPLAAALYLLEADLSQLLSVAGPSLVAFALGAVGTVVGTVLSWRAVGSTLGPDGWKLAGALCASYIGGSVNFAATAAALGLAPGPGLAGAMAADNVAMAAYLAVVSAVPAGSVQVREAGEGGTSSMHPQHSADSASDNGPSTTVSAGSLAAALAAALAACVVGQAAATAAGVSSASMAFVALAASGMAALGPAVSRLLPGNRSQSMPKPFAGAEALGGALMLIFFATIGAGAGAPGGLAAAAPLAAFIALQLGAHLAVTLLGGRLLLLPMQAVLTASNANVGGPATAAAMAAARGWPLLVQPALLTGSLGYAIGTGIGCAVGQYLRTM